ncbi:MAG: transketolase [Synergistaceae bacterium]|jgi:transketolase|nr:transketolase [Synergistaceae bacterium]
MSCAKGCTYDGYRKALADLEPDREDLVFLEPGAADDQYGIVSTRRIDTVAAEQDLILTASGLALGGRRVFVSSPMSPLYIARGYEQIRAALAIPNLKVVLSSVQGGDVLNRDGSVRQMNEDFALMRLLPNMVVVAPSDRRCAYVLAHELSKHDGPAYIRLSYEEVPDIYDGDDSDFHIGGARLLTEGDGVTICVNGVMVGEALTATRILAQQGIAAEVIDCYCIKPFPEQMLLASVRRTGCCVVAEKHTNIAGLYGVVAENLCRSYTVPVRSVAIEDDFGQSGTPEELQEYYGLTHREIVHNVVQVLAMRRR